MHKKRAFLFYNIEKPTREMRVHFFQTDGSFLCDAAISILKRKKDSISRKVSAPINQPPPPPAPPPNPLRSFASCKTNPPRAGPRWRHLSTSRAKLWKWLCACVCVLVCAGVEGGFASRVDALWKLQSGGGSLSSRSNVERPTPNATGNGFAERDRENNVEKVNMKIVKVEKNV